MGKTDHSHQIKLLREDAENHEFPHIAVNLRAAADLLEVHDATGISLDNWTNVRAFVEQNTECPIEENGV